MGLYSRNRRIERRRFVLSYFGNKCNECGSTKKLEIDHIDRASKRLNVSEMLMYSKIELLKELKKCQLLCQKCHKKKCKIDGTYRKPGILIHGKLSSYTHRKCRCRICSDNFKEYKKKRKWLVRQAASRLPAK